MDSDNNNNIEDIQQENLEKKVILFSAMYPPNV